MPGKTDLSTPKISVGLAVRNGENYLQEAVDSILSQTFADFELIISDNASTDATETICKKYAAEDSRVRYHRNEKNIGGANNENLTFELSRGKYFRWAAHDDVCAPELLEKCVAVLEQSPDVVLCYSSVVSIDQHGNIMGTSTHDVGSASLPHERFANIASSVHALEETYGLIRSDVLRKTRLQKNYTDSDRTLMCELSLYGRFHQIQEPLFFKRLHPENLYIDWRTRMAWFDPSRVGKVVFPYWVQLFDYLKTIRRVPISTREELRCHLFMVKWLWLKKVQLIKDLAVALRMLLHSSEWRKQRYMKSKNWAG